LERTNWYSLEKQDISGKLDTDLENGLSSDSAKERLNSIGYNELVGKEGITIWQMLIEQFKDFLVLILIGASFVSAIIGEITDAAVIILIVVLNATLGVIQESKANKASEYLISHSLIDIGSLLPTKYVRSLFFCHFNILSKSVGLISLKLVFFPLTSIITLPVVKMFFF
jgi:magnesium-transporting ATPase (P-type)